MKKLIIKCTGVMKPDDRDRLEENIKLDLERNGFALLDDRFEVYEIDTDKEDRCDK